MSDQSFHSKIFNMLNRDEGCFRVCYDDATGLPIHAPVGNISIGIGHNLAAKPLPNTIIFELLKLDVADAISDAKSALGVEVYEKLTENRKLAIINLAFNMGVIRLRSFVKMIAAIKADDYELAAKELRSSMWATQVDPKCRPNEGRDDRVITLLEKDRYDY